MTEKSPAAPATRPLSPAATTAPLSPATVRPLPQQSPASPAAAGEDASSIAVQPSTPRPPPAPSALSSKTSAALSSGAPVSGLADEVYISYARSKHGWLYDIYKVGGMTKEEFSNRVKAKMEEDEGSSAAPPPSMGTGPNAAFANLNKEINKKFKK